MKEDRSCVVRVVAGLRQHIRSSSENSDSNRQRVRCGSRSHPWLLEAQTGQQVNISLLDFSGHGQRTQLDIGGLVSDDCSPDHVQYGYIVDKTNKNKVSICSTAAPQRHKHVYQSTGNVVEIVLSPQQRAIEDGETSMNFLLAAEGDFLKIRLKCNRTQGNTFPTSNLWLKAFPTSECYNARERHMTIRFLSRY